MVGGIRSELFIRNSKLSSPYSIIMRQTRGLGLFSGGLDSMLAALVLRQQDIEVTGLVFVTPFFDAVQAEKSAAAIGLPLRIEDLTDRFLPLIFDPPHGFGRWMNPCIDCHLLMLRAAGQIMETEGYDFLFTGEVLGQRPFSQNKGSLNLIAKQSGYPDLLVRPLSARLLKETRPEREQLLDRQQLLNISGRGRKRQMELATRFGLTSYPAPAGGCLLADPKYAARLQDLLQHQPRFERRDLELLQWGRHFRLSSDIKLIVGRDQRDNLAIEPLVRPEDAVIKVQHYPGPLVLLPYSSPNADLRVAAEICVSYSNAPFGEEIAVAVTGRPGQQILISRRCRRDAFQGLLI